MKERKKKRPNQTTTVSLVTHGARERVGWWTGRDTVSRLLIMNDVEPAGLLRRRAERSPDL
jgi:hypothetical protein